MTPNMVLDWILAPRVSSREALSLWRWLRRRIQGLSWCGARLPHSAVPYLSISHLVALPAEHTYVAPQR